MKAPRLLVVCSILTILLFGHVVTGVAQDTTTTGAAQRTPYSTPPPQPPPPQYIATPSSYTREVRTMEYMTSMWWRSERQLRLRNIERQKQMLSDMDKLSNLVAEFKDQVAAGKPAATNFDIGKSAGEIEKLAHKVGQGMKK